jgi:hypothetical protein
MSAAYTGLQPPPAKRLREAYCHVINSYTHGSHSMCFHGTTLSFNSSYSHLRKSLSPLFLIAHHEVFWTTQHKVVWQLLLKAVTRRPTPICNKASTFQRTVVQVTHVQAAWRKDVARNVSTIRTITNGQRMQQNSGYNLNPNFAKPLVICRLPPFLSVIPKSVLKYFD